MKESLKPSETRFRWLADWIVYFSILWITGNNRNFKRGFLIISLTVSLKISLMSRYNLMRFLLEIFAPKKAVKRRAEVA